MLKLILTFFLLSAFFQTGCYTYKLKNEEPAQQTDAKPVAESPQQIAIYAASIFANAPNLTDEQKKQLNLLYTDVYEKAMTIRSDIGKYKTQLYMTLVRADYKSSEISMLRRKIVALDQQRLDIMFQAVKDMQKIVGRGADKESIYKHLSEYDKYK